MKCLVTGGAGFIGSHLVELLLSDGHKVQVVDNLSIGSQKNFTTAIENSNFSFFEADISSKSSISDLFIDVDWVFHLAGLADIVPSIENPDAYFASNVIGTYNIAQLAKEAFVKKVIYAASSSCYGIPDFSWQIGERRILSKKSSVGFQTFREVVLGMKNIFFLFS